MSDEIKLPSGAVLKVQVSPFAVSKALYQAILRELKKVSVSAQTEMSALYKDIFCLGSHHQKLRLVHGSVSSAAR